jgi:hypothetical protein
VGDREKSHNNTVLKGKAAMGNWKINTKIKLAMLMRG